MSVYVRGFHIDNGGLVSIYTTFIANASIQSQSQSFPSILESTSEASIDTTLITQFKSTSEVSISTRIDLRGFHLVSISNENFTYRKKNVRDNCFFEVHCVFLHFRFFPPYERVFVNGGSLSRIITIVCSSSKSVNSMNYIIWMLMLV